MLAFTIEGGCTVTFVLVSHVIFLSGIVIWDRRDKLGDKTPKIRTLEHTSLHKPYINEAIVNIFLCWNSLYDLQEQK